MTKAKTNKKRYGLTLVELLVVVVILVLLVGVALPLAQPALNGRDIREASRQINAMFAGAKVRAASTGEPVGVMLVPDASGERCYSLAYAKVPPPYAGETVNWRVRKSDVFGTVPDDVLNINPDTFSPSLTLHEILYQSFWYDSFSNLDVNNPRDLFPRNFVMRLEFESTDPLEPVDPDVPVVLGKLMRRGQQLNTDLGEANAYIAVPFQIRLANRGAWWRGVFVDFANSDTQDGYYVGLSELTVANDGFPDPMPATEPGVTFQITRPAKKSAATPMELPVGSYIDLTVSGVPQIDLLGPVTTPVSITFNPDGSIQGMTAGPMQADIASPVFLLIGNQKNSGVDNLKQSASSLWAVVDPSSGNVRSIENIVPPSILPSGDSVGDALEDQQFFQNQDVESVMNALWGAAIAGPSTGGR